MIYIFIFCNACGYDGFVWNQNYGHYLFNVVVIGTSWPKKRKKKEMC